jgi:hypothetical protein
MRPTEQLVQLTGRRQSLVATENPDRLERYGAKRNEIGGFVRVRETILDERDAHAGLSVAQL